MVKVVCAIIIDGNKILVAQHGNHPHHPYKWEFPGGKVEKGESPEGSLQREIKEELNIEISIQAKLNPVVFNYGVKIIELIPFVCYPQKGDIQLNEHIDFAWVTMERLFNLDLTEADKELVQMKKNKETLFDYARKKLD